MGMNNLDEVVSFLARVRDGALSGSRPVYLDLSNSVRFVPVICLLLSAEVRRCNTLRPGSVAGCDPWDKGAALMLEAFDFHAQAGVRTSSSSLKSPNIHRIQSGLGDAQNPGALTRKIADICTEFDFRDRRFANRVHATLNEATENSITWGYHPLVPLTTAAERGRWWVAGVFNPTEQVAMFMALDHGVGIPATAPLNEELLQKASFQDALKSGVLSPLQTRDHLILREAIHARRSLSGLPARGKGLPAMLALVDVAGAGRLNIFSGRGAYFYARDVGEAVREDAFPLNYDFPGTLVIWQIKAPSTGQEEV